MLKKFFRLGRESNPSVGEIWAVLQVSNEQVAQTWGPVSAVQRDVRGNAIQKYVTALALVQSPQGALQWFLLRQVNNICNGHESPSRPTITEVSEESASTWLQENDLRRTQGNKKPWR